MEKRWIEHSKEEQIKYISENDEDCTFLVGMKEREEPKHVNGFKEILSSVSPVFERMFNGDFKEAVSSDPVIIEDIYFDDFKQFLAFVQNDEAYVANWKKIYAIAKKYMADEVVERIISVLSKICKTPNEAINLFEIMYLEGKELAISCYNGLCLSFTSHGSLIDKAVKKNYTCHLEPKVFLVLLKKLSSLSFTATVCLFTAVENYCAQEGKFSSKAQKTYFTALFLNEIQFKKMTHQDFVKYVDHTDLLDLPTKQDSCRNLQK